MSNSSPRTVLITGAEGALGTSVVQRFLAGGCKVLATYLHEKSSFWEKSEHLIPLQMNVTDPSSIRKALASVAEHPVEGWIHCAGGFRWALIDQFTDADLNFLIDANFKSAFFLARELVPQMKTRGYGRIVLVGARATQQATSGMGPYAASKAAINMLTQALADEVRGIDINVNAVLPTIIDTPANRKDMPKADFSAWVSREQLAEVIFSLTQPLGKPIHGALIPVSGRL